MKQAIGAEQGRKPRRLGRGLSALIGEAVEVVVGEVSGDKQEKRESEAESRRDSEAARQRGKGEAAESERGGGGGNIENGGGDFKSQISDLKSQDLKSQSSELGAQGSGLGSESSEFKSRRSDFESRVPGEGVRGAGRALVMVGVGEIVPSPWQPRRGIEPGAIERLAESIRHAGVMQPVVVRERPGKHKVQRTTHTSGLAGRGGAGGEALNADGARYELVAGERRWRAATMSGVARIPAVVVELTDEEAAEWGLVENLQREDLNAMERGWALKRLSDEFGMQVTEVAARLGLERSSVSNLVRLTELEASIAGMIERGELTGGHGKALLAAPAGAGRTALALRAEQERWSVRRLEAEVKKWVEALARGEVEGPGAPSAAEIEEREKARLRAAAVGDLEKQLSEHLGTKVKIVTDKSGTKGRFEVSFYGLDHFEAVAGKLGFVSE